MEIRKITLHHIEMNLKMPFAASYGTITKRPFIIVEMEDEEGQTGWGECAAFAVPWYTEETINGAWHILEDVFIPEVFQKPLGRPEDLLEELSLYKRNYMAKSALDEAVWDLFAKRQKKPLAEVIGGKRKQVKAGVVVGIQPVSDMLKAIDEYLAQGYERVKVKIKPGKDREILAPIRERFPNLPLMADANSSYTLNDIEDLQALDEYNLLMIEQPLGFDDIIEHSLLQKQIQTPICLDESITSYESAKKAVQLGGCKVVNLKIGRVGGITAAKRIHDLCKEHNIPVWCGGLLESGIGRAHNVAISTLDNFVYPGDLSASSRYWEQDIVKPEWTVQNGTMQVPDQHGIGVIVDRGFLERLTVRKETFKI
ncbi:o-succinylbenzoate synthase [Bacillus tianshenii]|nr:o-succinylbenzoate synthase [Bacillus tianshenii]